MNTRIENLLVPQIASTNVVVTELVDLTPVTVNPKASVNEVIIEQGRIVVNAQCEESARQGQNYVKQLELLFEGKVPTCQFDFYNPVWRYRGFHIDVVRHFMSVKELKRIIRAMALVGFNHFHWHLTDDQGWRFAVDGYEKLESISSKRVKYEFDDERNVHSGFYSDADLKDVVDYCSELGIEVIPEVEMPGHAEALLAAYPEFGCTGKEIPVQNSWGIFENVMNPASEQLWTFLKATIAKLVSIFPSKYIHIGGDECPHVQWETNEGCQRIMKENGLKDTNELQGWFTSKASALVKSFGKRAIGWDEVVDAPEIDESVVVMSWRGLEGAKIASSRGHEVILTPQNAGCYLDRYQTSEDYELGNWSICTARDAFDLDISMKDLPQKQRDLILGAQCNLWAEKIHTGREAEYMMFPRAFILADNLWLGEKRDWDSLCARKKAMADLCYYLDLVCSPAKW
ncbi:MAG: family 20 glycosylhydrolase [Sphaerochaetaceae bacterium]|nr:family 20 glycosylhydrolase [Sphaerochaetaceae bacterium]